MYGAVVILLKNIIVENKLMNESVGIIIIGEIHFKNPEGDIQSSEFDYIVVEYPNLHFQIQFS